MADQIVSNEELCARITELESQNAEHLVTISKLNEQVSFWQGHTPTDVFLEEREEHLATIEQLQNERDTYMLLSKIRPAPFADTDAGLIDQVRKLGADKEQLQERMAELMNALKIAEKNLHWRISNKDDDIISNALSSSQPTADDFVK